MTKEEKIAWLRRYQESLFREKHLLLEIEQLRARAERITRALTGMPAAPTRRNDAFLHSIEAMMETESQLLQQVDQAMRERSEIEQAIQAYPDPHGRELLRLHYLCGKTFEQAAECMGISTRWAYSLHRAALEGIQI